MESGTGSRIGDRKDDAGRDDRRGDGDRAPRRRVLQGVGEEVVEQPLDLSGSTLSATVGTRTSFANEHALQWAQEDHSGVDFVELGLPRRG